MSETGRQTNDETRFKALFESALGFPFTAGNRIRVLRNGDEIFPAMLEAIESARESVEFVTYVYWTGDIARRFANALADRARDGVRVQVLLDGVGAAAMPDDLTEIMERAGVELAWFRPPVRWKLWKSDHRTHRKILVIDGRLGFTGGVGIAEEWEGDARDPSEWRETHFEIEGPAVLGLRAGFLGNWSETERPAYALDGEVTEPEAPGDALIQVVRTTASVGWSDAAMVVRRLIWSTQRSLRVTTAYFVPDDEAVKLLCDAAQRGVEVDIVIPGPHIDMRICEVVGGDVYEPLLEAGVRIWRYQKTMIHSKVISADGVCAAVGSANFNQRSMRKDDEMILVVIDRPTIEVLDHQFEEDKAESRRVEAGEWRQRGLWRRVMETALKPIRHEL